MSQLYRITPLEKKNVEFRVEVFERDKNGDYYRGFILTEVYRWGQGFRELDNLPWDFEVKQGINCDPSIGWGCEFDDLISAYVEFDGDWADHEKEYVESILTYETEDEEGRQGAAWIFDGNHNYEIELDEVIIYGPLKIDLVDDEQYNVVIEENVQPYVNEA